jgi:Chaperone of endosialidase
LKRTPVDPKIGEAALRSAAIGEENLRFMMDVYKTDLKPLAERQAALAEENSRLGMDIARENQSNAREDRSFYEQTYRPLEQQLASSVADMNTDDYADRKASDATASIETGYAQAQAQARRNLARNGVTASSGQLAAQELNGAIQKAGMTSQATIQAREQADALKFARTAQVASLGRGVNSDSMAATQIALQGGSSAIAGQGAALAGTAGAANVASSGAGLAMQGNNQMAGILERQQAARMNQSNANASAIGSIIGTGAGLMLSDETKKTDIKQIDSEQARKRMRKVEPKTFRYIKGQGPDGEYTHAMAQDMQKAGSNASDGHMVNIGSEVGELHAAAIGVDKRIDKLAAEVRKLTQAVGV